jgi:hypothetical protein
MHWHQCRSGSGSRVLITLQLKNTYFCHKLHVFILGLHERLQSYRRLPSALKREHPALHSMKFILLISFFWVIFAFLDPDLDPAD